MTLNDWFVSVVGLSGGHRIQALSHHVHRVVHACRAWLRARCVGFPSFLFRTYRAPAVDVPGGDFLVHVWWFDAGTASFSA